jgi:HK97 family phage prohead protease
MKNKGLIFVEITKIDEEQRIVGGYATTDSVDLEGEIIDLDATREAVEEYRQWGNVRYMHQPHAVGVVKEMEVDDKGLYVKVKVVDDECWVKVKEGVLKAFSIGFRILDCIWDAIKEAWRITKYRLIEISLVDRPANPDCAYSVVKRADVPEDAEVAVKFPKAPEDEPWDGDASNYKLEEYARACAFVKGVADPHRGEFPGDLTKGDCKLPHHKPNGTLVWRGVSSAMAALLGARGGVKGMSEAERKRAYSHLKKHYKEFDKEVPEFKALIFLMRALEFLGLGEVNELLARLSAGASTEEDSEMTEEQIRKLVTEEVGKAKADIVAELGGKLDEIKSALPESEPESDPESEPPAEPEPATPEGAESEGAESEPEGAEAPPETPAEPSVDEKLDDIRNRLKSLEAGSSRAATGQDPSPGEKKEKWSGVLDNVFLSLPRQ